MQKNYIQLTKEQLRELNIDISSLKLQVVTANVNDAGTDGDIYFDIGCMAWHLNKLWYDDFEEGADDVYKLSLRKLVSRGITLNTNDIIWLRLHIKGIFGMSGLGQSVGGNWKPEQITLIINETYSFNAKIYNWLGDANFYSADDIDQISGTPILHDVYQAKVYNKIQNNIANDSDSSEHKKNDIREENKISDAWVQVILDLPGECLFANSLRIIPNTPLDDLARDLAFMTTPFFKEQGVSGWKETPYLNVEIIGKNLRAAARSNDSFATIDIELFFVKVNNYLFQINIDSFDNILISSKTKQEVRDRIYGVNEDVVSQNASNSKVLQELRIIHKRYIRAEYKFQQTVESKSKIPKSGELFYMRGKLKWDTDFEGWYEIHPNSVDDITIYE